VALPLLACAARDVRHPGATSDTGTETAGPDVPALVIGGGVAGLATAMDLPAGSVVLEAAERVGGRALDAGGYMLLVETEEQEAAGIEDSAGAALADWEALTGGPATTATEAFLTATPDVRDRLAELGVTFRLDRTTPVTWRQLHSVDGGGPSLVTALQDAVTVEIRLETPVASLDLSGPWPGVVLESGEALHARDVVIASGGFANRVDLVEAAVDWADGTWATGTDEGAQGDALDWAARHGLGTAELGAVGANTDVVGIAGEDGRPTFGEAVAWVWSDADGARFADETQGWSMAPGAAMALHEPAVAITTAEEMQAWIPADAMTCAADWDALSSLLGVPLDGLLAEVAAAREAGQDDFGRTKFPDLSVGTPCAFPPGRLASKNFGGLAVDDDGRVLDAEGAAIEGLWAVGEAAGMGVPGMGGVGGFDGSLSAVVWSGWRTAAAVGRAP
jgi:succinate dehydrogenase/fumarate reductase flavoprotein subunit